MDGFSVNVDILGCSHLCVYVVPYSRKSTRFPGQIIMFFNTEKKLVLQALR